MTGTFVSTPQHRRRRTRAVPMAALLASLLCSGATPAASNSAAWASLTPPQRLALQRCDVDADGFDRLLTMDQAAFDQDFDGGWRAVAKAQGCRLAAATVIEAYLLHSRPSPPPSSMLLRWHAGQMLAMEGLTNRALAYFQGTYKQGDDPDTPAWNLYVDATIAFLRGDRAGLEAARH
jgi:hypothetical protein